MTAPISCPECGRQVPPQGLKLCPHCGYPLMLDRPAQVEQVPHKIVHKPQGPADTPSYTMAMPQPGYGPPPPGYGQQPSQQPRTPYNPPTRVQTFGPHCPNCRHVNPPARKRCEFCAAELWPGAAAPGRWMPDPPPITPVRPRRTWWKTALAISVPLVVIAGVWALAYWL